MKLETHCYVNNGHIIARKWTSSLMLEEYRRYMNIYEAYYAPIDRYSRRVPLVWILKMYRHIFMKIRLIDFYSSFVETLVLSFKVFRNERYAFVRSRVFSQTTLAVRKLVGRYFFIVGERLFFGLPSEKWAPKNGDEKESRRAGHFLVAGREYVGFTSCGGNKTSILMIARSRVQKTTIGATITTEQIFCTVARKISILMRMYLIFSDLH